MKLSNWITVEGFCATRVIEGTDPNDVKNRVAFIEKSPRVRLGDFTEINDFENWEFGPKGSDYGEDEESREWCDNKLLELGYEL